MSKREKGLAFVYEKSDRLYRRSTKTPPPEGRRIAFWRDSIAVTAMARASLESAYELSGNWRGTNAYAKVDALAKKGTPVVAYLDYPITGSVKVTMDPVLVGARQHASYKPGYLMWELAQVYKWIYRDAVKFGVWGHEIRDLYFEDLVLYDDGRMTVGVGS